MLTDLLKDLISAYKAGDKKAILRAFKNLEKVGVDRRTAVVMAHEVMNENEK